MTAAPAPRLTWRRAWPALGLATLAVLVFAFDLDSFLGFESLRAHRAELVGFVGRSPALAALLYVVLYAASVSLFIPGATVLTIAGGFLFGTLLATGLTVVGATVGAIGVFAIARSTLGETLRGRAGPWLARMAAGFRADAFNYLLVLRLVPLFPFFVVNIAPAFLGVPLRTFATATFIGIIPGTFVFASVGAGIGSVLESGEAFSVASLLTPEIVLAMVGLAALALVPVVHRRWRRKG
jgi:uncharacterized membrane protein YdjX (TVP38/TMEM64 family)